MQPEVAMAVHDRILLDRFLQFLFSRTNGYIVLTIVAVSFGSGFQHVYCSDAIFMQSINPVIKEFVEKTVADTEGYLKDRNDVGNLALQFLSIFYSLGSSIGCLLIPTVTNRLGRKLGLWWNNCTILVSVLMQCLSKSHGSYGMLFVGRFLIGLSTWLGTGIALIYIVESTPVACRGFVGTTYGLAMSMAVLITQILACPKILGNESGWPWLFAVSAIPAVCQIILLPFCPAVVKASTLGKRDSLPFTDLVIEDNTNKCDTQNSTKVDRQMRIKNMRQMWRVKALRTPLMICSVLMIGHYFGSVGVLSFLPGDMTLISSICVLSTGICMLLVNCIGRKKLLLIGIISMSIIDVLLFTCLLWMEIWDIGIGMLMAWSVALVIVYVIAFSISLGTLPWVLVCELSSCETRPETTAIAFSCYWISHWCFQLFKWALKDILNAYFLLLFSFLTLLLAIFVHRKLPPTQGETFEEASANRHKIKNYYC